MMHVADLKLEEDVFPCFNYTNHPEANSRLLHMLREVPQTKAAVMERQATIQGFLANWHVLEGFTYRRLDLREVHNHFEDVVHKRFTSGEGKLRASLRLRLSETERQLLRSKLVQMVLLLSEIQSRYLARLNRAKFPPAYKKQLQDALSFLTKLRLEKHAALITEDRFTVPAMVAYTQLLRQLNPEEILAFWEFFFSFEAYWSVAKGKEAYGFRFGSFSDSSFTLEGFYHPGLKEPVKNNLTLDDEKNVLLLTGPNMSGKSTLLKAIGLCVYLAHVGFPVPATLCGVPYFSSIAIAINLSDSLRDGYSHFMAEIVNLKAVVKVAAESQKCFAVFDEIFRGTNLDDALDITKATINGLAKRKSSFFLISTHMLQLDAQLDTDSSRSVQKCYIECLLEKGIPTFSYRLREGWSQLKIGRLLFDKEGLPELLGQ